MAHLHLLMRSLCPLLPVTEPPHAEPLALYSEPEPVYSVTPHPMPAFAHTQEHLPALKPFVHVHERHHVVHQDPVIHHEPVHHAVHAGGHPVVHLGTTHGHHGLGHHGVGHHGVGLGHHGVAHLGVGHHGG